MVVLILLFSACKTKGDEYSGFKMSLPKIDEISNTLNFIFTYGFHFSQDIKVDKIGVERRGENRYKIFYFFSEGAGLSKLDGLNIAFRVYPKNPKQFKNKSDQETVAKTIASKCKLSRMGEELVVSTAEFTLVPKAFKESKVYLYDPDKGIFGKTMTILNLNFDF